MRLRHGPSKLSMTSTSPAQRFIPEPRTRIGRRMPPEAYRRWIWLKHFETHYTMLGQIQAVVQTPHSEDSAGRCLGHYKREDGVEVPVLFEWIPSVPEGLLIALTQLRAELSTNRICPRPDEVRTPYLRGYFLTEGGPAALLYDLSHVPTNLRDVIRQVDKPSANDRRRLAKLVVNQVRSLHVHFRNKHLSLRTSSFVFPRSRVANPANRPPHGLDLDRPYILDWGRADRPSVYQHPRFNAAAKLWYFDIWSMLIVMSEIINWEVNEYPGELNKDQWIELKMVKKEELSDAILNGMALSDLYRWAFGFLDQKTHVLDNMPFCGIKRFFDILCRRLEDPNLV